VQCDLQLSRANAYPLPPVNKLDHGGTSGYACRAIIEYISGSCKNNMLRTTIPPVVRCVVVIGGSPFRQRPDGEEAISGTKL
jgi:hypothetical protein